MLNVFVVGRSHTGKTPLAQMLAENHGLDVISGSEWVRQRFVHSPDLTTRDQFVRAITRFSKEELAKNPDACIDFIRRKYPIAEGGFVIEGLRNPRDFATLFRPHRDVVLFLHYEANTVMPSDFECQGIAAIETYVQWLVDADMLNQLHVGRYKMRRLRDDEPVVEGSEEDDIAGPDEYTSCNTLDDVAGCASYDISHAWSNDDGAEAKPQHVHAEIKPIDLLLEERYLYDLDPAYAGKYVPCRAFAVSSYEGHAPTFQVQLGNGAVFSYIPAQALRRRLTPDTDTCRQVPEGELVYHDCPMNDIVVQKYRALGGACRGYFHKSQRWVEAEYLFTVDWHLGNDLLHCVVLDTGQIALLPQHKLQFGVCREPLPRYRKLHAEWKVEK